MAEINQRDPQFRNTFPSSINLKRKTLIRSSRVHTERRRDDRSDAFPKNSPCLTLFRRSTGAMTHRICRATLSI